MPCLRTSRRSLASTKWSDPACCIGSSAKCSGAMMSLTSGVVRDKSARLYPRLRRGLATRPRTPIHRLSRWRGHPTERQGRLAGRDGLHRGCDYSAKVTGKSAASTARLAVGCTARGRLLTQGKQSVKAGLPTEATGDGSRSRLALRRRFMRASSRRSSPASVFR